MYMFLKELNKFKADNKLYLVERINILSGFFVCNNELVYIISDIEKLNVESIKTEFLELRTHVNIHAVENDSSFSDGDYNLIIYKGDIKNDNLSGFLDLCFMYSENMQNVNFKEFFYSLTVLFQLPSEQGFINAIGLYGELKFIEFVFDNTGIDISNNWHKKGSQSKNDFTFDNFSIEVKTTLGDNSEILIKHDQIFNRNHCSLVVVNCENDDLGETLIDVKNRMISNKNAYNSLDFYINLTQELKRVSPEKLENEKFSLKFISGFDTDKINPFNSMPGNVSALTYRLETGFYHNDLDIILSKLR